VNAAKRLAVVCALISLTAAGRDAELVDVRHIWGQAPHSAFTDLTRFKGRWYCAFREGSAHVSPDGAIRVLSSADGVVWVSAARLAQTDRDFRDPKLVVTPDDRLVIHAAAALPPGSEFRHQSFLWSSYDGRDWTGPIRVGEPDFWLWRVTWRRKYGYGVGYHTVDPRMTRLYVSTDGYSYSTHVENLFDRDYPNESSILFLADETALCLLRRDGGTQTAQLGRSTPPYRGWTWQNLGMRIGGPHMIQLRDDRIVAAARFHDGGAHTALAWLDAAAGTLTPFLKLPSSGDSSYPGLVFHDGMLWVSYYSSHEGKSSIYLARVRFPRETKRK
jgi:hypothetical protein